jgi:DNA invertase Pin-like site-specific DNA recombinase
MFVCHRCDTPLCVNPEHLFAGSPRENSADMYRKGRGKPPPRSAGEENPSAKLDFLDVALVRTLLADGMSHRRIACELGVGKSTITRIANNQTWATSGEEAA